MSLFKYKPPKKIILDERSITTLDSKHKELQGEFQYIQDTIIPALENERNSLKERLHNLKNGGTTQINIIVDTVDTPEDEAEDEAEDEDDEDEAEEESESDDDYEPDEDAGPPKRRRCE